MTSATRCETRTLYRLVDGPVIRDLVGRQLRAQTATVYTHPDGTEWVWVEGVYANTPELTSEQVTGSVRFTIAAAPGPEVEVPPWQPVPLPVPSWLGQAIAAAP